MRWLFSYLLLAAATLVSARSATGNRLLVVLEDSAEQNKYVQLWADLKGRGFDISFDSPKSESLSIVRLGERTYDHLFILPSKAKGLGPNLSPKTLLEFINKQGNILLGLSGENSVPAALSSLLLEFDIQLPPDRNSLTIDHFNYDTVSSTEQHDVLVVPQPKRLRDDTADFFGGSGVIAVPRAVPQVLGPKSPHTAPILRAGSTAYTYNPKESAGEGDEPFATGSQISLFTGMQARNSARFTVVGSIEAFEDTWFKAKVQSAATGSKKVETANRAFAEQVTGWTFQELGVLKSGSVQHFLATDSVAPHSVFNTTSLAPRPESLNPTIYRIRNDVTFMAELSQWSGDSWAPFTPPTNDEVQLEFSMLSPFHRIQLEAWSTTKNSTFYGVSFETPDQHGIFSFRVNYNRPFLTNIEIKEEVTLRHFAHDEWPRSYRISGAWVWISGIWVTIAGWVVFVALWLYSEPKGTASRVKKNQ